MSGPATLNFSAYQGATFSQTLTWKDGTGTPINLTGATAKMLVKNGSSTLQTLTTENGGITLGGTAGTIALLIEDEATATLTPCNAEYDLLVKMGDTVRALVAGAFTVRRGTTLSV